MSIFETTTERMEVVWETRDAFRQRNATGHVSEDELGEEKILIVETRSGRRYVVPAKRLIHAREVAE